VFLHRLHRFVDNIGAIAMLLLFICSASMAAFLFGLQSQIQSYFVLAGILWVMFGLEHWRLVIGATLALAATVIAILQVAPVEGPAVSTSAAGSGPSGPLARTRAILPSVSAPASPKRSASAVAPMPKESRTRMIARPMPFPSDSF
jgi:hypothetical protein